MAKVNSFIIFRLVALRVCRQLNIWSKANLSISHIIHTLNYKRCLLNTQTTLQELDFWNIDCWVLLVRANIEYLEILIKDKNVLF